jgi:hypothetical protein
MPKQSPRAAELLVVSIHRGAKASRLWTSDGQRTLGYGISVPIQFTGRRSYISDNMPSEDEAWLDAAAKLRELA